MGNLKDGATSTVLTAPSPATSGTTLVVQSGEGALFPAVNFFAIIHPDGSLPILYGASANAEVVQVTNISTDTLTIVRAQKSTTAKSVAVTWRISNAFFKTDYDDKQDLSANLTAFAAKTAPSGTVVGDTDVQTISGKVLSDEFIGDVFDSQSATKQNVTLGASTDYVALDMLEVGATKTLEVPATSSLEVVSYTSRSDPTATALVPIATIHMYAGAASPTGWLICDGSAISRTTYANLFNTIGVSFGAGNGTSTFNIPDFRGRLPVGVGTGTATGATAQTLGSQPTTGAGGEQTHVQTQAELAAHTHTVNVSGVAGITIPVANGGAVGATNPTSSTGSSTPMNMLPPMSVVNFIIKV